MDIAAKDNRIVWVDLEMTGLDPSRHVIVEVAALVTDAELNIIDEGVDLVVHATDAELAEMDDFVTQMHSDNGLLDDIKASTVSLAEAEDAVLGLVEKHCDPAHPAPLAGNSIATDRTFIRAQMPRLDAALHYELKDSGVHVTLLAPGPVREAYIPEEEQSIVDKVVPDFLWTTYESCAADTINAMRKNRRRIVPGPLSKAMDVVSNYAPRGWLPPIMGKFYAQMGEE